MTSAFLPGYERHHNWEERHISAADEVLAFVVLLRFGEKSKINANQCRRRYHNQKECIVDGAENSYRRCHSSGSNKPVLSMLCKKFAKQINLLNIVLCNLMVS